MSSSNATRDGGQAELLADQRVDPRIGLAKADHADSTKTSKCGSRRERRVVASDPGGASVQLLREGGDAAAVGADSPDRFEHARARDARLGDLRHQMPAVDP